MDTMGVHTDVYNRIATAAAARCVTLCFLNKVRGWMFDILSCNSSVIFCIILPAVGSLARVLSKALVTDWNKFIFWVGPKMFSIKENRSKQEVFIVHTTLKCNQHIIIIISTSNYTSYRRKQTSLETLEMMQ